MKQLICSTYKKSFKESQRTHISDPIRLLGDRMCRCHTEASESMGLMVPKEGMTFGVLPSGCIDIKAAERQRLNQSALDINTSGAQCSCLWALHQFEHTLDYYKVLTFPNCWHPDTHQE